MHTLTRTLISSTLALLLAFSSATAKLPEPTSAEFCVEVQKILANTEIVGTNEVFDYMPDYRASKPSPNPLMIYQIVTYDEVGPIVVSCKVKTVDHLQAEYGADTAGPQVYCPVVTAMVRNQAIAELLAEGNAEAAAVVESYVLDQTEPYLMGSDYLSDFQSIYVGDDGEIHVASPGLQSNWEGWLSYIMPDRLLGQTYCHLATADYMKRVATGDTKPGAVITTVDDAPVTPPGS